MPIDIEGKIDDAVRAWLRQCPESFPLMDANSTDEEFDEALEIHIADAVRWLEDSANTIHWWRQRGKPF